MRSSTAVRKVLLVSMLAGPSCGDDSPKPSQPLGSVDGGDGGAGGHGGASVGGAGGSGGVEEPPLVSKFELLAAGPGSRTHDDACTRAGEPSGCDVCDALGFYGDLECDTSLIEAGLCVGPDPGCSPREADYYVAPGGNDANDGTESAPFATIQRAHDAAAPGDFIYVRGGTYRPTAPTTFSKEGTANAPIVLQSYPGEIPTFDATGVPSGDEEGASTPTWVLRGAKHWQLRGPLHLTQGRGPGLAIEGATQNIDIVWVESSYNGQTASRGGHGFLVVEAEYATAENIRFLHCDAHHNANHRTIPGEPVDENLYQHGDGFRIKSGANLQLIGCRSWNNLDDGYDLVWAGNRIVLHNCWAANTGRDDALGTITGTPGFEAAWGEGIKLSYASDTGRHVAIRCLSWGNVHLGFRMDGGPNELLHCSSYKNGRRALGWDLGSQPHVIANSLDFDSLKSSTIPTTTTSTFNSWDPTTGVTVTAEDFVSLDDSAMFGPRSSDGSLPVTEFLRLTEGSDLVDAGTDVGQYSTGAAPDLGCYERP